MSTRSALELISCDWLGDGAGPAARALRSSLASDALLRVVESRDRTCRDVPEDAF